MKKIAFSILIVVFALNHGMAQTVLSGYFYGQDAFRFSNFTDYGTARARGLGGALTALGGDASSALINPAGLGFYNRSEVSISPLFARQSSTSSYLSEASSQNSTNTTIGHASAVFRSKRNGGKKKSSAFAISYHTLVNFNNSFNYAGSNNRSSIMDYFAEQANYRGESTATLDSEFDQNTGIASTPTSMYYQAYLIDPNEDGYVVSESSFPVNQAGSVTENGKLGQVNLAYGVNLNDRTYLGASVGLQSLNYNVISRHTESFPNGQVFNGFAYVDELLVKGTGINLSLGAIYKITSDLSAGVNVSTPTALFTRETFYSSVNIDQKPEAFQTDFPSIETAPNDYNYKISSPLRANFGLAYLLPEKLGILSVEAEYVGYKSMRLKDKSDTQWTQEQSDGINNFYNNVLNVKAGAEARMKNFRLRTGVNILGNPYQINDGLDRSNAVFTFGGGYRSAKFFADLAYSIRKYNSAYTPYVLSDPANYGSATVNNKSGDLSITVGTFF